MAIAITSPSRPITYEDLARRRFKRLPERVIVAALYVCGTISVFTTIAIVVVLFEETFSFFREVSPREFLFGTNWQPLFEPVSFGVWEIVAGTINVVFWSILFALPVGIATAIYQSEYAHPRTRRTLKPILEALAGVPTVVYAYFALLVITQDILTPIFDWNVYPFTHLDVAPFNSLGASIVMAIMILPTIASLSEDAMANVPRDLREAAYALGSTRMEVALRVVVPAALSGVVSGILLAIARVIGETMIVAVAAGSTPNLTLSPLQSIQTMTGYMLQIGLGDVARGTVKYESLFAVGSLLFVMTFSLNALAQLLVSRFREQYD